MSRASTDTQVGGQPVWETPTAPRRSRWSHGWRRLLKWVVALGVLFGCLALAAFAYAYATIDVPDPNKGFQTQTTNVYYADGKTVLGTFAKQNRTSVPLSEVPVTVQEAFIAAEDKTFRTNQGIDPKGIVRAAFNNASGGSTQGASTITQQYVKVLYLTQERSWQRKAKEAILSLKIQRQQSKEEILEGYLNTIYFGRGAYGIEAAAQAYFDKPARALTIREGAALAAVINSPSFLDPAGGKQSRRALAARYRYVTGGMAEAGTLPDRLVGTPAARQLPVFPRIESENRNGGQRGHVLAMVREELLGLGFSEREIDGGGLRVTTSFTKAAMGAARAGVRQERPDLKGLHVAAASVDPRSGALRGMYAGQDYLDSQLNWAVAGGAAGSAFKPFSLAAGLSYGYALNSTFEGNSPLVIGDTEFENQGEGGGTSYGSAISLLTATQNSVNTAYIDLAVSMENGLQRVIDTAVSMGVPADTPGLEPNFSNVLGSATVSPIDMANAYGTIAAGGKAKQWYVVEAVTSAEGDLEYQHRTKTSQVISADIAADTSYALQQVAQVGTGTNANTVGRPVAGKTGTATDDEGHVRSSWFVGYTPQLATAVMYVRGDGNQPLDGFLDTFYGGEHPALTWAAIMSRALDGAPVLPFPPPVFATQTALGHEPYTPPPSTSAPPPAPSPTPSPTRSPSPSPSRSPETAEPSSTPEPSPTDEPSPNESPSSDQPATDDPSGPGSGSVSGPGSGQGSPPASPGPPPSPGRSPGGGQGSGSPPG